MWKLTATIYNDDFMNTGRVVSRMKFKFKNMTTISLFIRDIQDHIEIEDNEMVDFNVVKIGGSEDV